MMELASLIVFHKVNTLKEAAQIISDANQNDQVFLNAFQTVANNSKIMFDMGGVSLKLIMQTNADIASLRDRLEAYHAQSRETATSGSR